MSEDHKDQANSTQPEQAIDLSITFALFRKLPEEIKRGIVSSHSIEWYST